MCVDCISWFKKCVFCDLYTSAQVSIRLVVMYLIIQEMNKEMIERILNDIDRLDQSKFDFKSK